MSNDERGLLAIKVAERISISATMSRARQKPAKATPAIRRNPLASLRMADMVISKPYLPAGKDLYAHITLFLR